MIPSGELYARLLDAYGDLGMWDGTPFSVMAQAVLVQNTSWSSVLRIWGAFHPQGPSDVLGRSREDLEAAIRPCGLASSRARTLTAVAEWYEADGGGADAMTTEELRGSLLGIRGVGPETADVFLVYAFGRPAVIVDAYLRGLLGRLGSDAGNDDDEIRAYVTSGLPPDAEVQGRLHRLVLEHGASRCGRRPSCGGCPLSDACPSSRALY